MVLVLLLSFFFIVTITSSMTYFQVLHELGERGRKREREGLGGEDLSARHLFVKHKFCKTNILFSFKIVSNRPSYLGINKIVARLNFP